ncbi:MAG: hypothetical protein LBJ76_04220 [Candidatus Accumulibacter sp.]|nr:hypothetical protein [Accumulibacter sp.]
MIYAITDGIPTFSSVWDKYTPMLFEAAARKTLKKVEGVLEVESFTQSRQGDVLAYEAVIRTTFGRVTLSNTRL